MNNLLLLQQIRGSMRNPEPLSEENFYLAGRVRCIHIAERMDVTLPSASRAVKELEKMEHGVSEESFQKLKEAAES